MPIFDVGSPAYQGPTTVGTSSSQRIWSGTNTALVNANSTAITVRDLMVQNTGTAVVYVGQSGVTAVTGQPLPSGAIMVIQGWTATTNTTTNDVFAVGGDTTGASTVVTGLGTLISVV